jgi:hypothetical protein
MPTKRVSPLKAKRQAEKDLQNYDDLNTIMVPVTTLRFELAELSKKGIIEYPLGDLLLVIQTLISEKEST